MYFSQLNEQEQQIILACMKAVLEDDELKFEHHSRLGIDEKKLKEIIEKFPNINDFDEDSNETLAINNCLNEICHGIRFTESQRQKYFAYDREKIREVYKKWAELRGWKFTGVR
jgi:phage FluMu gp28-like protein